MIRQLLRFFILGALLAPAWAPAWAQTTRTLAAGQLGVSCNSVTVATANNPGTVGGCTAFSLLTSGGTLPNIYTWSVVTTGSPTGISVSLVGSLDGVNWTTLQTVTTATSQTTSPATAYRWLGCIPTAFTGGTVTCQISVTAVSGGGTGAGVSSINGIAGAFTFNPGSVCTGTTCTFGAGSGTVSANNTAAGAVANYAAAGGSTTVQATTLNYTAPILTVGNGTIGNGELALSGTTSGVATFIAPSVAGTSTNGVTMSNVLLAPNGSATNAAYGFTADPVRGLSLSTFNTETLYFGNGTGTSISLANGLTLSNNYNLNWATASVDQGQAATIDTALNRVGAGIVGVGTTNGASTAGSIAAASFQSRGTTFTASGCGNTTLSGGATAGQYTSVTAGSCTVTITMGNSATAPAHWVCDAHDLTTVADANNVTMGTSTTTTANLVEGTVAANDVIAFKCTGY